MPRELTPLPMEVQLRGSALQMPLVESLGSIHSRSASRILWHAHPAFEMLLLLSGVTRYELASGDILELTGGRFLVMPPGLRHRGLHEVRPPVQLCGLIFDPRKPRATNQTPFLRADLKWMTAQFEGHPAEPWPMSAELRRLAAALSDQVREARPLRREQATKIRLTTCAVLWEAARQLTTARALEPDQAVRAAVAHMEQNYREPLSIGAIAEAVGCSRARLFQIFKDTTGVTPNDYLQRLRVSRAAHLLTTTGQGMTEIALQCGFETSQYFSTVFRKYQGTTPSAFRADQPAVS